MTAASVCLLLGLLLVRTGRAGLGSVLVAVTLGLVLAGTSVGPTMHTALDSAGSWVWANGRSL